MTGTIIGATALLSSSGRPVCTVYQHVLTPDKAMKVAGTAYQTSCYGYGPNSAYLRTPPPIWLQFGCSQPDSA